MEVFIKEEDLIREVLAGDRDAYAGVVRSYQVKVLGLCTSLLGNATQAEDAAQEIFIKAYQSLQSFRGDSSFSTWLYRITINHCLNQQAKKKRQRWFSLDFISDSEIEQNPAPTHDANNRPDTVLEQKETELIIQNSINSLPKQQRIAIILSRYEGLTYQEIAEVMHCSVASVESRLFRAKQNLYRKLRPYLKDL